MNARPIWARTGLFPGPSFARELASPFPLLVAVRGKTSRIEIGKAVADIRYENPVYMAETASAAHVIAGGRLQLGIRSPHLAFGG